MFFNEDNKPNSERKYAAGDIVLFLVPKNRTTTKPRNHVVFEGKIIRVSHEVDFSYIIYTGNSNVVSVHVDNIIGNKCNFPYIEPVNNFKISTKESSNQFSIGDVVSILHPNKLVNGAEKGIIISINECPMNKETKYLIDLFSGGVIEVEYDAIVSVNKEQL